MLTLTYPSVAASSLPSSLPTTFSLAAKQHSNGGYSLIPEDNLMLVIVITYINFIICGTEVYLRLTKAFTRGLSL